MKFDEFVSKKLRMYITEDAMAPDQSASAAPSTPPPDPSTASADASPTPQEGASTEQAKYDKPYQDLAKILYKALRLDFDDLGPTLQQKIMNLNPDNIESDQQGVSIFKEVEAILNEQQGSEPSDSGFGPGANKL